MEIANSKNLLVEAYDEDGKFFIAFDYLFPSRVKFRGQRSEIISIEHLPGNNPTTTVHTFKDMDEFIESITWHDWIKGGDKNLNIKNHYIKFRV